MLASAPLRRFLPRLVLSHHAGREEPPDAASEQHLCAAVMLADVSGFTPLTERLAQEEAGAEQLTRILNAYFGALIERILASGGDVVKFAGDALVALWPAQPGGEAAVVWRAARCGLDLQRFSEAEQPRATERLSLKVSVGLGPMRLSHLGGRGGRWEVLVTGEALEGLGPVALHASPGQVRLTPAAADALGPAAQLDRHGSAGGLLLTLPPAPPPPPPPGPEPAAPNERALRGYLPPSVLDRLGAGGDDWLGELRVVTVMFVNFPNATHQTSLERAQGIMEALQATLERYEGVLNKLSCDEKGVSMVAAFGLPPRAHEDDPARAVLAALSLHRQLRAREVRHAIGLATGRVFCGVVGSPERCEYTVMGDTVNLAARLMQAAKEDVLCDRLTAERAGRRVAFEALSPLPVKGKAEPVPVRRPRAERSEAPAAGPALLGRVREREEALAPLRALAGGGPGAPVVIEGEPGIGKSVLAAELAERAAGLGLSVLAGAADPVSTSLPFAALAPALSRMLGLAAAPTEARVALARAALGEARAPLLPLLAPLLSLELGETPETAELSGPLRADRTRALLLALFSEGPPRLLLVEDAHWLDSASWALLLTAQRTAPGLCVALSTRPQPEPAAELGALLALPGACHLRLGALSPDDALELACARLGVAALPAPVAALLSRRAGGHPYFTEELALALRDTGRLRVQDGLAELTGPLGDAEAALPHSVEGAVTARVDRLPPPQQLLLKTASVIGRSFEPWLLREIYPLAEERPRLDAHLVALERLGLVEREPNGEGLRFKHALTREAIYPQVLRATRRDLHRGVAEALERRAPAPAAALAYHWIHADAPERAAPHLERAGALALEGGAYREAEHFLRRALALGGPETDGLRPARLHRLLGDACLSLGALVESRAELEQAVALLGHPAPRPGPGQVAALAGRLLQRAARHLRGPRRMGSLLNAGAAELRLEGARAYERLGQACFFFNEPLGTLHASAMATELAEPVGPGPERARAYANLCLGLSLIPLPFAARAYEARARAELARGLPHAPEAWVRMVLGMFQAAYGRRLSAREELERAHALSVALGDSRRAEECQMILTALEFQEDRPEAARVRAQAIVAAGVAREDVHMQSGSNAHLAASLLRLGLPEEACAAAERGRDCAQRAGARAEQVYANGLLALARVRLGDPASAAEAVEASLAAGEGLLPTAIYAFEGYAAAAEAALELRACTADPRALARWRSAHRALRAYARTFPIARPRSRLLEARAALMAGRVRVARRALAAASEHAARLAQPFDAALAEDAVRALRADSAE